jgi:hypothetical protein
MENESTSVLDDIENYIKPQLDHLVALFMLPRDHPQSCYVMIPTSEDAELSIYELSQLVARTSNNYAVASRLSGAANALEKRAEGLFKLKYKKALAQPAKNADERESNAYEIASEEYERYIEASSLSELATSMKDAARVASESARKLLDKAYGAGQGESRVNSYANLH